MDMMGKARAGKLQIQIECGSAHCWLVHNLWTAFGSACLRGQSSDAEKVELLPTKPYILQIGTVPLQGMMGMGPKKQRTWRLRSQPRSAATAVCRSPHRRCGYDTCQPHEHGLACMRGSSRANSSTHIDHERPCHSTHVHAPAGAAPSQRVAGGGRLGGGCEVGSRHGPIQHVGRLAGPE